MKIEEIPTATVDAIRKQYGYRTKAALCREFKLTDYMFNEIIRQHGIERINPAKVKVKPRDVDYSKMQGIPVPTLTGNAIVFSRKGKDPNAIISKYKR